MPLNAKLSAFFDTAMGPLGAAGFTLKQGTTVVAGTVSTTADGRATTFAPEAALAASSAFTATVSTAAKSRTGTALSADRSWSFTTGTEGDSDAPSVSSTNPAMSSTEVAINTDIAVTFSESLDPMTLTSTTFSVKQAGTEVAGTVSYGPGTTATFKSTSALPINTLLSVTLSAGVKDLQGNSLASAFVWSFTTGATAAKGPARVALGTAGKYTLLAKAAVSSVPPSVVTGDVGLGPAAASYITGFSLVADSTNVFSTSTQIIGQAFAANYAVPTPSALTTAVSNMESAYTDAASRPTPDFVELATGDLGGKTLLPGLYKWTSTVTAPADVVISGGANDVWIFQTSGDLTVSAAKRFTLAGGAQAKNIFWQVAGKVTLGAGSHLEGVVLCRTEVTLLTGSTLKGRILAQTQIALQQATVTNP